MLRGLVLALILCGLGGGAFAGDAGANPPSSALDSASAPGASSASDTLAGGHLAGSGSPDVKAPPADVDIDGVHMSLHMMGGAGAGGAIRP